MIQRSALINAVREYGYGFKKRAQRTEIWKKAGSTDRIHITRRKLLAPEDARYILQRAGMPIDDVERFLAQYVRHQSTEIELRSIRERHDR